MFKRGLAVRVGCGDGRAERIVSRERRVQPRRGGRVLCLGLGLVAEFAAPSRRFVTKCVELAGSRGVIRTIDWSGSGSVRSALPMSTK